MANFQIKDLGSDSNPMGTDLFLKSAANGALTKTTFSALKDAINSEQNDALAIVANGNTHHAITSGQFVYVRNHSSLEEGLYKATAAIGTNAKLSTSNLTADESGGLNDLQAQVSLLKNNMGKQIKQLYYGDDDSVSFSVGSGSRHILLIASSGAPLESAIVFVSLTNAGVPAIAEAYKGSNITSINTSVNNRITINWNQAGNRFYFDIPLAGDLMVKV